MSLPVERTVTCLTEVKQQIPIRFSAMENEPENKALYKKALSQLTRLSSRKEMCQWEAMEKLRNGELSESDCLTALTYLTQNRYIDDTRYAEAFVNDKIRFQKWGKAKIRNMLYTKHLSSETIDQALSVFDTSLYEEMMTTELLKKQKSLGGCHDASSKAKLFRFGMSRGFDADFLYRFLEL